MSSLQTHIISFTSVDPYRIRNPYGYGKWSHNHRVYKTMKTIFVSLAQFSIYGSPNTGTDLLTSTPQHRDKSYFKRKYYKCF